MPRKHSKNRSHGIIKVTNGTDQLSNIQEAATLLTNCLIYARALLEHVIFIVWVRSVSKMLPSVKFAEDKVLTFLILREEC